MYIGVNSFLNKKCRAGLDFIHVIYPDCRTGPIQLAKLISLSHVTTKQSWVQPSEVLSYSNHKCLMI